ncbi:BglG family transcription antiterminator [Virgibacillus sp. FSP13]
MLNSRLRIILQELMAAKIPITGGYLANLNQVTPRTTRADVKQLDSFLSNNGALIDSVRGKGYKLEITDETLFRAYLQTISTDEMTDHSFVPESQEARTAFLIKRLLLSGDYVKLDDLADELYVSKSTIQNYLKQVKAIFAEYGIHLESRPNYGLKAIGNELKLRFCLAEYLFDHRCRRDKQVFGSHLSSFAPEDLTRISDIIMEEIQHHQIILSDIAMNNLLIHIAIAYKRIKSGYHVTLHDTDLKDILQQKEYLVATEIVQKVEHTFNVAFPQSEVAYIAIHLLGTKLLTKTNTGDKLVKQVMDEEIVHLVNLALDKIEAELNLGIKDDKELKIGLSLHLKPAINRYKYGMNVRNPMLADIKTNYPLAFEAGILAGLAIKDETGIEINENEVGYLALHIGAAIERRKMDSGPKRCLIVCASGLGTAQLIFYKLKNYFGKSLDVVGTTEYYQLINYQLQDVDFIVSSIPIEHELSVPVVEVNAILGEHDLEKIERVVVDQNQGSPSYFQKELMFLRRQFDSKEAVLQFFQTELLDKGLVDSTLLEAVYEREKVAPTSFGNLVAVPHPITPKSNQTFLAVCTLEKAIMWNNKPVQFICLLCVKKDSMEDLQSMYDMLGNIIDQPEIVQHLVKAKTYEEFIHILAD